jgi:hypothetical protein
MKLDTISSNIYASPPVRPKHVASLAFLTFTLIAAPLLYGFLRGYYGLARFGPVAAAAWSQPWIIAAMFGTTACLAVGAWLFQMSRRNIELKPEGLILTAFGRMGWGSRLISWDEIAGITVKIVKAGGKKREHKPHRYVLTLFRPRGLPLRIKGRVNEPGKLGEIDRLPELTSLIKAKVYPRLLPRLKRAFHAGQPVAFGPVSITREVMWVRRSGSYRQFPWAAVKRLTVQSGFLVVELNEFHASQAYRITVNKIPNLELLMQLISQGAKT